MKTKINGILTLLLAFMVQLTFAQERTISGIVSDDMGPISDISVKVKGTTTGAVTDFDGKYAIKAKTGDTLVFSHISYDTLESIIGASNKVDVIVKATGQSLDEVVVTGVSKGISTKKLGFKVDKVNIEESEGIPTIDMASALAGKVAGVKIVRGSGNPMENSAIVLRGASSIIGDTDPLILIDGIITDLGMNEINMDDIESIEIVKGAAAGALYGSLAGNGVVQIITKKGRSGNAKITIGTQYGISKVTGSYPVANKHDRFINPDGSVDFDTPAADGLFDNDYEGSIVDNIDAFIKPQPFLQNSLSISQKVDKINYYVSAQNSKVDGILKGIDPFKKQNYRVNLNTDVTNKLKLSTSASYNKINGSKLRDGDGSQGANLFYQLLKANPTIDFSELDNTGALTPYYVIGGKEDVNPLYRASHEKRIRDQNRFIGGINASYEINDNFDAQLSISMDKFNYKYTNYYHKGFVSGSQPVPTRDDGYLLIRNLDQKRVNTSFQLNYNETFGNIKLRSAFKYLHEDIKYAFEEGEGFNFAVNGTNTLATVTEGLKVRSYADAELTQNYFLTADLDWKDKIIIGGVVRTDRSSLFGPENRDQLFYRGSLAYRIGEDLKAEWIDEMKLRVSYGTAGLRPGFSDYRELYFQDQNSTNIQAAQAGNPDLQSPVITELEFGLDLNFLQKYKFGFTYAKSDTEGALLRVPLTASQSLFSSQMQNAGNTEYKSIEISLSGTPIQNDNFTWNFGLSWNKVSNSYGELGVAPFLRTNTGSVNIFRVEENAPYGAMYGMSLATSVDQLTVVNGLVINHGLNLPLSDFKTNRYGNIIVSANEGVSGNLASGGEQAILLWDEATGQAATKLIGDTTPDFNMGISNTFKYKNLSLYALFDIQKGGDVYNKTKQQMYYQGRHSDQQNFGADGQPSTYSNAVATLYGSGSAIDYFVEDASFVKLREVSLSYNITKKILKSTPLDNVLLSLSGRNLWTITDYSGWDPEVAVNGSPIFRLDEWSYPNFKTYTMSLKITF